mgnify:CR=1 FL=1
MEQVYLFTMLLLGLRYVFLGLLYHLLLIILRFQDHVEERSEGIGGLLRDLDAVRGFGPVHTLVTNYFSLQLLPFVFYEVLLEIF